VIAKWVWSPSFPFMRWLGSVDILNDVVDLTSVRMPPRVGTVSSMAEVGLVHFARVTLEVAEAVLPDYRTKFSKRTFTQSRSS
jgi:hypothetical protein